MKLFKRHTLALFLALVMLFLPILVSCGQDEPAEESSQTSIEIIDTSTLDESSDEETVQESTKEESSMPEETTTEETTSEETTTEESSSEDVEPIDPLEAEINALLETKHRLTFNEDGSFRVLILADTHLDASGDPAKVKQVRERITALVDKTDPNLVIFTGDNIIGSANSAETRLNILHLVKYIEEQKIPWCHVYGNHDHEGGYPNVLQQNVYESFEYCISKIGPDISGVGNYVHAVYKDDGSIGAVIYCLDSGSYDNVNGGYAYIKDDQIAWYKETSEKLQEYNGGEVIPALMAFHIPLTENNYAHQNRDNKDIVSEYTGSLNEGICCSKTDTDFFETIVERGDVKAIVTGHDHVNDYMYKLQGIKLCASPNISDLTYFNSDVQGARVFDLNPETINDIPTYVEYLIERVNPDDYDAFENDVKLEISDEKIINSVKTGYNSGGLDGTVTVGVVDGKGAEASRAIQILRSQTGNFEVKVELDKFGKLGENKYVIVWMDLSRVEFRKACIGLISNDGKSSSYRTDDKDTPTPFYYLADGADTWQTLSHGYDGCFGTGDGGSQGMFGKKGYFAFPVENLLQGTKSISSDTLITGFYLYADISSAQYANVAFYLDDIALCEDYTAYLNK